MVATVEFVGKSRAVSIRAQRFIEINTPVRAAFFAEPVVESVLHILAEGRVSAPAEYRQKGARKNL